VETIQRADPGHRAIVGSVYPGDRITMVNVRMTRDQWKTVGMVALRPDLEATRDTMVKFGFGQKEWGRIRDSLVDAGLMAPAGSGENGENAGYTFTAEGMEFFRNRKWMG